MQRQIRSELHTIETDTNPRGRAPESVNHELIFRQISSLGGPATQSMTSRRTKEAGARMPNSNDVASVEVLWGRVLSLLVVGASVLGGRAVLLIQAVPPILHGFHKHQETAKNPPTAHGFEKSLTSRSIR